MVLHPKIAEDLKERAQKLLKAGKLRTESELSRYYSNFAKRFAPAILAGLEGEELLETLHNTSNKDSLVYWLEFKSDEDFSTNTFGSIAGGSALKFLIYKRRENGQWTTGSSQDQKALKLGEAIAIARKHRDELIAGAQVLERFRAAQSDDYGKLQEQMLKAAPSVGDYAWGHKYFHLLFPEILDDFHQQSRQRYHLIKLLQSPTPANERYTLAKTFVSIARELKCPMNQFTALLNDRDGSPHKYYRIGSDAGEGFEVQWKAMREGAFVAVGWPALGDLSDISKSAEDKENLKKQLKKHYKYIPTVLGKQSAQLFRFVAGIHEGDYVLAANGATILGIGRVKGEYFYAPGSSFPNRLPVDWLCTKEWKLPIREGLMTTVHEIGKEHFENLIEIERVLLEELEPKPTSSKPGPPPLTGIVERIESALERKGQVILFGPPGTGKTYWAEMAARELASRSRFQKSWENLGDSEQGEARHAVWTCTFHSAYGYEDFIEGYRPTEKAGHLMYELKDGIFKKLCGEAARAPGKNFYLIIDEINRGDVPRIFGELLTVIEKTRRSHPVMLATSGENFQVPKNVFVIGTMNTADRSIALLDAALRRRFGFVELLPDSTLLKDAAPAGIPLRLWLNAVNERLLEKLRRDARNLQIGHAYFMHDGHPIRENSRFVATVRDELIPLLEEYCYEDYEVLESILGSSVVDLKKRRIREELFETGNESELARALLEPYRDILGSPEAQVADISEDSDAESDEEEGTGRESPGPLERMSNSS